MPTRDVLASFWKDWHSLTPEHQQAFRNAVEEFVADLREGRSFRPGLRVKGVRGHAGIFEMTWSLDGRATFQYGEEVQPGEPHIVWRRIGTHDIFRRP